MSDFKAIFNKWKGKRSLPTCAKILGVSEGAVVNWASRGVEPDTRPNKREILERMEANKEKK